MSEEEAIDAMPTNLNVNEISNTFSNPTQIFRMLDRNNDGKITIDDLQVIVGECGITGTAGRVVSKYLFDQIDANKNGVIEMSDLMQAGSLIMNLFQRKQEASGGY